MHACTRPDMTLPPPDFGAGAVARPPPPAALATAALRTRGSTARHAASASATAGGRHHEAHLQSRESALAAAASFACPSQILGEDSVPGIPVRRRCDRPDRPDQEREWAQGRGGSGSRYVHMNMM